VEVAVGLAGEGGRAAAAAHDVDVSAVWIVHDFSSPLPFGWVGVCLFCWSCGLGRL